jgi:hypothetical protein|tara:strand:- start:131 stop:613 length:483 start_codon:yes stop_codon:yes gene_type:complete
MRSSSPILILGTIQLFQSWLWSVYDTLKFNWNKGIQFCIAMAESKESNFNNIMSKIIKKSLFTERQIEIILNQKDLLESSFSISKGAYYRQVGQSREKLVALFYSIILLRGLGILLPDDIDVISKLSEQISVINESDIFPERENEVISVIEKVIRQASNM